MRLILLLAIVTVCFSSCNKDKYQTVPQITFKSITAAFPQQSGVEPRFGPKLFIEVTDAEGDLGTKGADSSWVFVKNITIAPFEQDSFPFPDELASRAGKDFKGEVEIALAGTGLAGNNGVLASANIPNKNDTLYFEVYVKDRKKNKSNVIKTDNPLIYLAP